MEAGQADRTELAKEQFAEQFGKKPSVTVRVPGRVNLIGDHTDYNDGFALPMAINRYISVAGAPSSGGGIRVVSETVSGDAILNVDTPTKHPSGWERYAAGVLHLARAAFGELPAFEAVVTSSIPKGAGLSSSAAFGVALVGMAEHLTGISLDPIAKASLCQKAEHIYAGVPCGIMDQLAIIHGSRDHAILLDCRSCESVHVPIPTDEVSLLVIDSGVERALSDGVYADRRKTCEQAADCLGVGALRDLSLETLNSQSDRLDDEQNRRARYVVTENERVQAFAALARESDWINAGILMRESHVSLRDDFEVSVPELDLLADEAEAIGTSGGVYGCRMTGGGLGGCVIALVKPGAEKRISAKLANRFDYAFGRLPTVHHVRGTE
ncbi:MAG: galactokinase [Leptolyngbya sp. SIO3F4]|nr:galactokinase [Leptolyngbya sp. SIO3F4]